MKKKIITFAMAFMLLFVGGLTLTGCGKEPTHTHKAIETYYTVENNKAYFNTKCDCGDVVTEEIKNAVIATPETAQAVLDSNINNKTVVFSDGEYSKLDVRPTKETGYVREFISATQFGTIDLDMESLENVAQYHYFRKINNIKFVATENALFTGKFTFSSTVHHYTSGGELYDPIRDISYEDYQSNSSHTTHLFSKNIEINGLNFSGAGAVSWVSSEKTADVYNKNIAVKNCSFVATQSHGYAAIYMGSNEVEGYENVVVENNYITKHYQGIMIINASNVEANNNTIVETAHNGIAVQSSGSNYFEGIINIKNNVITDLGNQAIKLNSGKQAIITIQNNTIENNVWANNKYVMQIVSLKDDSSYVITQNTFNGEALDELSVSAGDHQGFFVYKPGYVAE